MLLGRCRSNISVSEIQDIHGCWYQRVSHADNESVPVRERVIHPLTCRAVVPGSGHEDLARPDLAHAQTCHPHPTAQGSRLGR
jgi:hypothetical protein